MSDLSEADCTNCNGTFGVDPHALAPNDELTDGVFCPYCGEQNDFDAVEAIRYMPPNRWQIEG